MKQDVFLKFSENFAKMTHKQMKQKLKLIKEFEDLHELNKPSMSKDIIIEYVESIFPLINICEENGYEELRTLLFKNIEECKKILNGIEENVSKIGD